MKKNINFQYWYYITSFKINVFAEKSYEASSFAKGINKITQKVGEEAIEV